MSNMNAELLHQLKSAAQEEIMCREASDTSDAWQDLASPENILALIEIALPVLERQENGEHAPNHAQCCAEAGGDISICDCVNKDWVYLASPQTTTPQIDNDGWMEWGGGECPVNVGDMVEIKLRDGDVTRIEVGRLPLIWRDRGMQSDIIAYRVIENDGSEG